MNNYQQNWPQEVIERDPDGYIRTVTGKKFWVLDPRPGEVDVVDIAAALSNTGRWGGHCGFVYSVAQHAVLCAKEAIRLQIPGVDPYRMLHHDDSEGYTTDMPRPIKRGLPDLKRVENDLMLVIGLALKFSWPMTHAEHDLDNSMLIAESREFFRGTTDEDFPQGPIFPVQISGTPWRSSTAEEEYLALHEKLKP